MGRMGAKHTNHEDGHDLKKLVSQGANELFIRFIMLRPLSTSLGTRCTQNWPSPPVDQSSLRKEIAT